MENATAESSHVYQALRKANYLMKQDIGLWWVKDRRGVNRREFTGRLMVGEALFRRTASGY